MQPTSLIASGALTLLAAIAPVAPVQAQPGKLIKNVKLPVAGRGVSVAVDCADPRNGKASIYYTLDRQRKIFVMDSNGKLLRTLSTSRLFDEMAFDPRRNVLWAQEHGSNPIRVYRVNIKTGASALAFTSRTRSVGTFRDGIAYDLSDDSIWLAGDVSSTVDNYAAATGTFRRTITPKSSSGRTLGAISGLVAGRGDLLLLGQNGRRQIVSVKKSNGAWLGQFASPGGARDEGLECDGVNFTPRFALWSREFNSPGFMSVIELAPGTCLVCSGNGNLPPVFDPTAPCGKVLRHATGRPLSFTVKVADPNSGDRVTLTAAGLPAGATLTPSLPRTGNPVSTVFRWTPALSQGGPHAVTFTATDNRGLKTTCVVTFRACGANASWSSYGSGWRGTLGVPALTMASRPSVCRTSTLRLGNAAGKAAASALVFGLKQTSQRTALGGTLLVDLSGAVAVVVPTAKNGASVPLPIPCLVPPLCGLSLFGQGFQLDPGAAKGVSFTRGLQLTLGN